jgi:tetratricopeptide (TPR) repeat protein
MLVSLLASSSLADDSWKNERVMLKETAKPRVGNQSLPWSSVPMPGTVTEVNGPWLWLGGAWVKEDDVVKLADAPAYYTTLINRTPNYPAAYVLRGLSWMLKGDYDNALKDTSEAIRLEPSSSLAYMLRGKIHYLLHHWDLAIDDFTESIRLDSNNLVAYNDRGVSWNAKSEFQKAYDQFNEVLRMNPNNALAYSNRGANWYDQQQYEKALADMNKAVELDPKFAGAYANRGTALDRTGDYPRALEDYDRAIKLAPHEWGGYNGWARVLSTSPHPQLRDGRKAREMATRACELSHWQEWKPMASLAAAYAESGDFANAVKWQEQAMKVSQPAKDHDQQENTKRLETYKAGKAWYAQPAKIESAEPPAEK